MSHTPPGWDPLGFSKRRRIPPQPTLPVDTYRTPVEMNIVEDSKEQLPLAEVFKKIAVAHSDPLRNKKIKELADHAVSKSKKAALKGRFSIKYKKPWYIMGIKWDNDTQRDLIKILRKDNFIVKNFVGTQVTENYTFDYPEYPIEICW